MQINPYLVLAVVGGLVGGLAGADQVRTGETTNEPTMTVVAIRGFISAPAAPAVGTGFVVGGELFEADGSTKAGYHDSHCGVLSVSAAVPPEVIAHCTSTFRLKDGELHFSSLRTYKTLAEPFNDTTVAITGGTGTYSTVRGQAKTTQWHAQRQQIGVAYAIERDS